MIWDLGNQKIPFYRLRIVFLTIVFFLLVYAFLGPIVGAFTEGHHPYPYIERLYKFIGLSSFDVYIGLFLASPFIILVLLIDLASNAKWWLTDTLPGRRKVSLIVISVEILVMLALSLVIGIALYIMHIGGLGIL